MLAARAPVRKPILTRDSQIARLQHNIATPPKRKGTGLTGAPMHVSMKTWNYQSGFPVTRTTKQSITVGEFPLYPLTRFDLPALRYIVGKGVSPTF